MATTTTELEPPRAATESYALSNLGDKPASAEHTTSSPQPETETPAEEAASPTPPPGLDGATKLKLMAAGFSFFVSGTNDGSIGALIPYVLRDHDLTTAVASIVYGASFLGWVIAAFSNTALTQRVNLGGALAVGAALQPVAHALRSWRPPFPLYCVTFVIVCLGQAYQDAGCNTYVAGIGGGAHRWLAFIHTMYMAGCFVAPFIATAVASAGAGPSYWYLYYTFPLALCVVNLTLTCYAFRDTMRLPWGRSKPNTETVEEAPATTASADSSRDVAGSKSAAQLIRLTLTNRSVILVSIFFFFYVGGTLTAVGWIVEYLVDVRDGNLAHMGYVPAGFSGGGLLGRALLAEPVYRFGERRMIFIFCVLVLTFQLIFWLSVLPPFFSHLFSLRCR